jgi:type IV pilus assembly protein PilN
MRISINLATHPFVELRPLFARLRIAMAALAVLAIGLAVGLHLLSIRAKSAEQSMDALKAQTLAVQTERQTNERRMSQPQNRAVLDRSRFLNALFARKSFSWTSVMMDLEGVLPSGVAVTSIEPAVTAEGGVNIRLRVSGDRDRAVDLVRNLEQSRRFLQPRLANETAQTEEGNQQGRPVAVSSTANPPGGVEFDILSSYNPLPAPAMGIPKSESASTKQRSAPAAPARKGGAQ